MAADDELSSAGTHGDPSPITSCRRGQWVGPTMVVEEVGRTTPSEKSSSRELYLVIKSQ